MLLLTTLNEGCVSLNKKDLLMTDFTVKGTFHDMALYSGILYLWKDETSVQMYHWKKWMKQIMLSDLPIYQYALSTQFLSFHIHELEPYFIKEITFPEPIRDFFIFRHQLYYITNKGFFVVTPESALLKKELLLAGDFQALSLSEKNRVILSSMEAGVFEYFLTNQYQHSQDVIHWDKAPTADVLWDGHNILQRNLEQEPFQLLEFHYEKNHLLLTKKREKNQLYIQENFTNTSLNLSEENKNPVSLFEYLSTSDPSNPSGILTEISVQQLPDKYFPNSILDETILYLQEKGKGLYLLLEDEPYLIKKDQYVKFRTFHKSHKYRNHLHLLSSDSIKFLIFNKQS